MTNEQIEHWKVIGAAAARHNYQMAFIAGKLWMAAKLIEVFGHNGDLPIASIQLWADPQWEESGEEPETTSR